MRERQDLAKMLLLTMTLAAGSLFNLAKVCSQILLIVSGGEWHFASCCVIAMASWGSWRSRLVLRRKSRKYKYSNTITQIQIIVAFQGVDAESLSKEEETGTVLMKIAQSLGLFIGKTRSRRILSRCLFIHLSTKAIICKQRNVDERSKSLS